MEVYIVVMLDITKAYGRFVGTTSVLGVFDSEIKAKKCKDDQKRIFTIDGSSITFSIHKRKVE